MTVQELIEKLQTMPTVAIVIIRNNYGEYFYPSIVRHDAEYNECLIDSGDPE